MESVTRTLRNVEFSLTLMTLAYFYSPNLLRATNKLDPNTNFVSDKYFSYRYRDYFLSYLRDRRIRDVRLFTLGLYIDKEQQGQ